jgi:hypothetical protein
MRLVFIVVKKFIEETCEQKMDSLSTTQGNITCLQTLKLTQDFVLVDDTVK